MAPNTTERIAVRSKWFANIVLENLRYQATEPNLPVSEGAALRWLLTNEIEKELLKRYAKGIHCLGTRASCPLMWSHYADRHRGLCIGYSVPGQKLANLFKVQYGGSRLVRTSEVAELLAGNELAAKAGDSAVLLRKAKNWKCEPEWRLLGERGSQRSPLELSSVTFGLRCSDPVKHAVVKALEGRDRAVKFYKMKERRGSFVLQRLMVNLDELSYG